MFELYQQIKALTAAITTGDETGIMNGSSALLKSFGDLLAQIAGGGDHKLMTAAQPGQDVAGAIEEAKAACHQTRAKSMSSAGPVGKLGDGTLLNLLLTNLPAILDMIKLFIH